MLLDPAVLLGSIPLLLLTLALIALHAAAVCVVIGIIGGWRQAGAIAAARLAQLGEFSYIIAETVPPHLRPPPTGERARDA